MVPCQIELTISVTRNGEPVGGKDLYRSVDLPSVPKVGEQLYFQHPEPEDDAENLPLTIEAVWHYVPANCRESHVLVLICDSTEAIDDAPDPVGDAVAFYTSMGFSEQREIAMNGTPIEHLGLSVRGRRAIYNLNNDPYLKMTHAVKTIEDLTQVSADELGSVRNVGETTVAEIREKMRALGFTLRGDYKSAAENSQSH